MLNNKERDKRVSRRNVNSLFELTEELCKSEEFLNKTTEASSSEAHWSAAKKQFDDEMWQDVETEEEKETATEYVGNKEMRMEGTKILREKKNKVETGESKELDKSDFSSEMIVKLRGKEEAFDIIGRIVSHSKAVWQRLRNRSTTTRGRRSRPRRRRRPSESVERTDPNDPGRQGQEQVAE